MTLQDFIFINFLRYCIYIAKTISFYVMVFLVELQSSLNEENIIFRYFMKI